MTITFTPSYLGLKELAQTHLLGVQRMSSEDPPLLANFLPPRHTTLSDGCAEVPGSSFLPGWLSCQPSPAQPGSCCLESGHMRFLQLHEVGNQVGMSNCQSGLSRWLGWPQGPAPSDTNWVRTRTMAQGWYWRAQPPSRRSSSSSSSLSRVGLMGKERRLRSGIEFMMLWSCKVDTSPSIAKR